MAGGRGYRPSDKAYNEWAARNHRDSLLNNVRFDANVGLVVGNSGVLGPKGEKGETGPVGPPGIPMARYVLSYAGLPFQVVLKTATFAMIEDATNVNGDDLELIKMVDKEEWENIRKMWCAEWHKRRGHKAFEMGLHEEFEEGFVHE